MNFALLVFIMVGIALLSCITAYFFYVFVGRTIQQLYAVGSALLVWAITFTALISLLVWINA